MKQQVNNKLLISSYFSQDKIGHAFLLVGTNENINYDLGLYLAKNLVCSEKRAFECQCQNCLRIDKGLYYDLKILGKDNLKIKKDAIINIIQDFSLSASEKANKKIYFINNIENATVEALNSLLKFLEEPVKDTYAIITTCKLNQVLPTIVSRCQLFYLNSATEITQEEILNKLNQEFYQYKNDFQLLVYCYKSFNLIKENINNGNWKQIKILLLSYLENLVRNNYQENYFLYHKIIKLNVNEIKIFFLILDFITKKIISNESVILFDETELNKKLEMILIKNDEKFLFLIYQILNSFEYNVNKNLIIDFFLLEAKEIL